MHIQIKFVIYYLLIFICAILGAFYFSKKKYLRPLFLLLPISLITELCVEYLIQHKEPYYYLYHVYGLIDTFFFCLLFHVNTSLPNVRRMIGASFFIYSLVSITLSLNYIPPEKYPALQYSLESFLLILLGIYYLFSVLPKEEHALVHQDLFWIIVGLIVFHSGILFINGIYNYLKDLSPVKARLIKDWVNMIFNYLLYLTFIIAIAWPTGTKKLL